MLQEYQRAREEAKVEIARARDRLRERTEQEKLRIRQQIISQLLRVLAANDSHCALVQRTVCRCQEPLPWEMTARRLRPLPHAPPLGTALG